MNLRRLTIGFLFVFSQFLALASNSTGQDGSSVSPWDRPQGSKALLESLGITLDKLDDKSSTDDSKMEVYLRVLTRMQQLPLGLIEKWASTGPTLAPASPNPSLTPGEMIRVQGFARMISTVDVPKELADRFDVKKLFRVLVHSEAENSPAVEIWTQTVPSQWLDRDGELTHEPIQARAVFMRMGEPSRVTMVSPAICVTTRISWFPEVSDPELGVTASQVVLGRAGFDVSLLDSVRSETSKRLTPEVTEPFLQMLAAQGRVDWKSLESRPLDLAGIVSDPTSFVGEAIEFDAIARRIVEIAIDDADDRKRLGIDRYYEIDLVLPKSVRTLVKDKAGREHEIVQENFPITICTTTAPLGILHGEEIRELVHAKAFFFKLWAYESKFAKAQAGDALQVSPLFITDSIELAKPAEMSTASALWVVAGALGILACVALWGYFVIRGDDRHERSLIKRREANSPPPPPLDATP